MLSGALLSCLRGLVDLVLPPRCPGCGRVVEADHRFCAPCWGMLDFLSGPACVACGGPFDLDPGTPLRCGACLQDPPAIDGMRAAVAYGPIARDLALRLKYGMRPGLAVTLARAMARLAPDLPDALVVPVPLHRGRLWRRGYNQSGLIARALARATGRPLALDLLERHRATPLLRGLGRAERRRAVGRAFRVRPGAEALLAGRAVLLVDDVYTSGATVNACARALKAAGADRVVACCWARVVHGADIDNGRAR